MRPYTETQMITTKDAKRSLRDDGFSTARSCMKDSLVSPREVGGEKWKTKSAVGVNVMKDF